MIEQTVTLTTMEGPMDAFLAAPEGDGPFPAVVVAQEAFGVNGQIQDVCRRLAREGYVALAPELFHRAGSGITIPYDQFESTRPYLGGLTNEGIESDLAVAMEHLGDRLEVDERWIGLLGFCMGGFAAFLGACRLDPAAAVSFYGGGIVRGRPGGTLQPLIDEVETIHSPILCFFGAEDRHIPPEDVEALRSKLHSLEVPNEVVVYPAAGHGFFNDQRPGYAPDAARDAWPRTLAWFARHMGPGAA